MWYTSGIESFISTMETSSLMGMNVAKLVVDGWERESERGAKLKKAESEEKERQGKEALVDGISEAMAQIPMTEKPSAEDL